MTLPDNPAVRYFDPIAVALNGLEIFIRKDRLAVLPAWNRGQGGC